MENKLARFGNKILEIVYPDNFKCIFCGNELFKSNLLLTCDDCSEKLPYISGKICECCGTKIKSMSNYCIQCKDTVRFFDQARAPFEYSGNISNAIKKLKTANAKYLVKPLALYMCKCFYEESWQIDEIVCVPLFPKVEKERGFNHSKLLAKQVSKILDIPYSDNLKKVKNTAKQTDMDFVGRQTNLEDAFKYEGECAGKNILIIDDVMTTGATVNTIAFELKRKGANKVYALTVARTKLEEK